MSIAKKIAALAVLGGIVVGAYLLLPNAPDNTNAPAAVVMPAELSSQARAGNALFRENCAACHGDNAGGSQSGPPLVHRIYEPGHHADYAFLLAVKNGVRAHHWPFGDMPPVPGVSESDVASIVSYVRELQRANGIE